MRLPLQRLLPIVLIIVSFVLLVLLFGFAQQEDQRISHIIASPTSTPSPIPTLKPTETAVLDESTQQFVPVVRVVDGDTITVLLEGKREMIRLIGINTPETVDPRRPVQCFGKEASDKAKELLTGKRVRLESDPTQQDRDRYGRLLRYAYLEDGTFFNEWMIEEGYAYEYTYNTPYQYQEEFKTAQNDAEGKQKGLWREGVCG